MRDHDQAYPDSCGDCALMIAPPSQVEVNNAIVPKALGPPDAKLCAMVV